MIIDRHKTSDKIPWEWVKVTRTEALAIIQSLVSQMQAGSPNVGRLESRVQGEHGPGSEGGYMTIAIIDLEEHS